MSLRAVAKNSSIYGIVSILQKALGFFLLPVYTTYLSTEQYGIVGTVMAIVSFLNVFYLLSLHGSLSRFYYEHIGNAEYERKLFGTILTVIIYNSVFLTLLFYVFRNILLTPFAEGIDFIPYLAYGLIIAAISPVFTIHQTVLQAKQEGIKYGKNNFLFFLLNIALTIIFLTVFDLKATGILLALMISNLVFLIHTLFVFLPEVNLGIDKEIFKSAIKYSIPLLPHAVSGIIIVMIDRIFINNMLSTSSVGIYNVAFQFGNIMNIITTAVNQAYLPWYIENMKVNKMEAAKKFANVSVLVFGFISVMISFYSKEIIFLLTTEKYHEAWVVVPFITFAFSFNGLYYFFSSIFFYDITGKGTRVIPVITILSAIFNCVGNYFLIGYWGLVGASVASLLSNMLITSVILIALKILYKKVDLEWKTMLSYILTSLLLSLIVYIPLEYVQMLVLKIFITSLLVAGLIVFYIKDLKRAADLLRRRK